MSEPLPSEIAEALRLTADRRGPFGEPAYFFSETASTNDIAAALADAGAPEGATVIAASQTAGRGRFGRTWFSPPGAGLYMSTVVREPRLLPILPLAAGVAVAEGVRAGTGLPVFLKWPNDVVVESGVTPTRRRKLAGVLAEASTGADGLQYAVLGIGINLRPASYPRDIADRATSIESELGRTPDAGAVLAEILVGLARCREADAPDILRRWRELAPSACGSAVEWDGPAGVVSGVAAGIDDTGALLVHANGGIERILSGEVRWI